jgi:iron complex transport system substrate-binding protein
MRTVSLFPSATELLAGMGATDDLVGRSHRCTHPEEVRDLPAVTESDLSAAASPDPGGIDAVVDNHHHGEDSYFRVRTDALRALRPEVLVTQSLCEVCAVPESMTADAMAELSPAPKLVSIGPTTTDELLEAITRVGAELDREPGAEALCSRLRERMDRVLRRQSDARGSPRVVCLKWAEALRCHGLWMPELIERLGAEAGFGRPGERGRVIEWDDVLAYDPEVLIVSPCGRTIPEIRRDVKRLLGRPGWEDLTAVSEDQVYLLDGELSSRHGPRVVRTLELLAGILYPDRYDDVEPSAEEVVRFDAGDPRPE